MSGLAVPARFRRFTSSPRSMTPRGRERPPVPPKELLFVYPPDVPGAEPVEAAVVRELPPREARWAARVLRVLHVWARPHATGGAVFDHDALQGLERELAAAVYARRDEDPEELLEVPLALILWRLMSREEVDSEAVAMDCLLASAWAGRRGYPATRLAFGEVAGYAVWDSPRWAWIAGRCFRTAGRSREAEQWYRRAARLARWKEDWEAMALSLNSLANTLYERGNFAAAWPPLNRALRLARRHGMKHREGEILHDLLNLAWAMGRLRDAEVFARRAIACYQPDHERLPALAYDVAYMWMHQGYFSRALSVLIRLDSAFKEDRLRLLYSTTTARAAGACGHQMLFMQHWSMVWDIIGDSDAGGKTAAALLDLGIGAASLEMWDEAEHALAMSVAASRKTDEADVRMRAEAALEGVRLHRAIEPIPIRPDKRGGRVEGTETAQALYAALNVIESRAAPGRGA